MRALLGAALLLVLAGPAQAADRRPDLPAYDIAAECRAQANYSFAATLGDSSFEAMLGTCELAERNAKGAAERLWASAAPGATTACLDVARNRYVYLARCLDLSRTVRTAR